MFNDLLIEDSSEYTGTYFDPNNMFIDTATEALINLDDTNISETDLDVVTEALLNSIDTDLEAIAVEVSYAIGAGMMHNETNDGSVGSKIKTAPGKAAQSIKNGLAKIIESLISVCEKHMTKCKDDMNDVGAAKWNKRKMQCTLLAKKLRGLSAPGELETIKSEIKAEKERIKKLKDDINSGIKAGKSFNKKYKKGKVTEEDGAESFESYSVLITDHDAGYEVVVEGLFSKPKTGEQLMKKMQSRVSKLKSIGACDDMLRQLDAEAAKFNSAISSLKSASAAYAENNDKKALRKSAGPVLKELNKTCKLLKIKNISSDPKNISQEEIAKLHDFITGAKQLINEKKKQLSGGATESMGYTDDMLTIMQNDDIDFNIVGESLIEDFGDADKLIAVATEGIISPDTKRAHRIKFGEKKRQITSVVKKARQAKKAKDYESAIALYQEAKKGYQGLLAEAKKLSNYKDKTGKAYASKAKTGLINWCIKKMSECDNAIEAIRNGQMKGERKAAAKEAKAAKKAAKKGEATESYLDDVLEYESVIESLGLDDDLDDFDLDDLDIDDDEDEIGSGIESLIL